MNMISKLWKLHSGQAVWIVGSDPTIDGYPDNFSEGKTMITLHLAHMKFPNSTYRYANEPDRVRYLSDTDKQYLDKACIFAFPQYGIDKKATKKLFKDAREPYFLKYRAYPPFGVRGHIDWHFTELKVQQAYNCESIRFGGHGTCLHGALYSAIMMGANPINIVGSGLGMSPGTHFGQFHSIDEDMRPRSSGFSDVVLNVAPIEQTAAIIQACKNIGVTVNWFMSYREDGIFPTYDISREYIEQLKRDNPRIENISVWRQAFRKFRAFHRNVSSRW